MVAAAFAPCKPLGSDSAATVPGLTELSRGITGWCLGGCPITAVPDRGSNWAPRRSEARAGRALSHSSIRGLSDCDHAQAGSPNSQLRPRETDPATATRAAARLTRQAPDAGLAAGRVADSLVGRLPSTECRLSPADRSAPGPSSSPAAAATRSPRFVSTQSDSVIPSAKLKCHRALTVR
jgi:hypothetical protein